MSLSQNLLPNQYVVVTASGLDAGNPPNSAPIAAFAVTIDDHSKAYAVTNADDGRVPVDAVLVAAKGPLGNYVLTVNATDANSVALPAATVAFSTVVGPAVSINLSLGTPLTIDGNTPVQPAGW